MITLSTILALASLTSSVGAQEWSGCRRHKFVVTGVQSEYVSLYAGATDARPVASIRGTDLPRCRRIWAISPNGRLEIKFRREFYWVPRQELQYVTRPSVFQRGKSSFEPESSEADDSVGFLPQPQSASPNALKKSKSAPNPANPIDPCENLAVREKTTCPEKPQ